MAEKPVEQMTLREMFVASERLLRELIDHLEKSFNPRIHDLEVLISPVQQTDEQPPPQDVTVRSQVAILLASDDFAEPRYRRLDEFLGAIDKGSQRAISEISRT